MKPILIDELVKEFHTQTEITRKINNTTVRGWQIAKPLNYDFTLLEKIKLIFYVLRGKAICVQYFEDMNETEKDKYIMKKLTGK